MSLIKSTKQVATFLLPLLFVVANTTLASAEIVNGIKFDPPPGWRSSVSSDGSITYVRPDLHENEVCMLVVIPISDANAQSDRLMLFRSLRRRAWDQVKSNFGGDSALVNGKLAENIQQSKSKDGTAIAFRRDAIGGAAARSGFFSFTLAAKDSSMTAFVGLMFMREDPLSCFSHTSRAFLSIHQESACKQICTNAFIGCNARTNSTNVLPPFDCATENMLCQSRC